MTTLAPHLTAALRIVTELEQLGAAVLSVDCYAYNERPRVHIRDAVPFLEALDGQWVDTASLAYIRRGVRYGGCDVYWLIDSQAVCAEVTQ